MTHWCCCRVNAQTIPAPQISWPEQAKVQDLQASLKDGDPKQGKDKGASIDLSLHPGYSNIASMTGIEVSVHLGTQATQIEFPTEDGCRAAQKVVASMGTSACLEIK
jgi:hypothetical protein